MAQRRILSRQDQSLDNMGGMGDLELADMAPRARTMTSSADKRRKGSTRHGKADSNFLSSIDLSSASLFEIAKAGKMPLQPLSKFLKEEVDEYSIELDRTLLMVCAEHNNLDMLDGLLRAGADYTETSSDYETVLEIAARKGNVRVFKRIADFIQEKKGEEGVKEFFKQLSEWEENSAVHIGMETNRVEVLRALVDIDPEVMLLKGQSGMNPLHCAAENSSAEAIDEYLKLLRRYFPDKAQQEEMLEGKDSSGRTPLQVAIAGSDFEACKLLMEGGADPCSVDAHGETAFFGVVERDDINFLKRLFEWWEGEGHGKTRVDDYRQVLKKKNRRGDNVLHCAAGRGMKRSVDSLIEKCPELLVEGEGELPIHRAVTNGRHEVVERLFHQTRRLRKGTDKRRLLDSKGRSLMHMAVISGHKRTLEYVLKLAKLSDDDFIAVGADMVADDSGFTPIHYLAVTGRMETLDTLLDTDQPNLFFKKNLLCEKTEDERTPMFIAARNGHNKILKRFLELANEWAEEIPDLLNMINEPDETGMTPMHIAALKNRRRSLQVLLQYRADCLRDKFHRTALHFGARGGFKAICAELVRHFPHIIDWFDRDDNKDPKKKGRTALHYAAEYGHAEVVELLLNAGAVIVDDSNLDTALDIAANRLDTDVVRVFITHERWEEILSKSLSTEVCERIVSSMPALATVLLDQFYSTTGNSKSEDHRVIYCLKYLYHHFKDDTDNEEEADSKAKTSTDGIDGLLAAHDEGGEDTDGDAHFLQKSYSRDALKTTDEKEDAIEKAYWDDKNNTNLIVCFGNQCLVKDIMDSEQHHLLLHPVIKAWIRKKWHGYVLKLHLINLFFYLLFLFFLTVLAVRVRPFQRCPEFYDFEDVEKYDRGTFTHVSAYAVMFLSIVNLFKEFGQMIKLGPLKYWTDPVNLLEWTGYTLTFIFALPLDNPPSKWQWLVGAIAIFLTWMNLILFLQRLTFFGIYVVMFLQILQTVMQALLVFVLFVCAFGFSFYILMSESENFSTVGKSLMTTVAMSVGEIGMTDNFFNIKHPKFVGPSNACTNLSNPMINNARGEEVTSKLLSQGYTWFFLLLFILVAPIILMNLLVGLAVGDIAEIRQQASTKIAAMQADLILDLETKLPEDVLDKYANFAVTHEMPNQVRPWYEKAFIALTAFSTDSGEVKDESVSPEQVEREHAKAQIEDIQTQQHKVVEAVQLLTHSVEILVRQQKQQKQMLEYIMKKQKKLLKSHTQRESLDASLTSAFVEDLVFDETDEDEDWDESDN